MATTAQPAPRPFGRRTSLPAQVTSDPSLMTNVEGDTRALKRARGLAAARTRTAKKDNTGR